MADETLATPATQPTATKRRAVEFRVAIDEEEAWGSVTLAFLDGNGNIIPNMTATYGPYGMATATAKANAGGADLLAWLKAQADAQGAPK